MQSIEGNSKGVSLVLNCDFRWNVYSNAFFLKITSSFCNAFNVIWQHPSILQVSNFATDSISISEKWYIKLSIPLE